LILFEDGKEVDRMVGLRDQAAIKQFVTAKAKR
jgi:thioredoxin-like negative regulator of GroEL